MFEKSVRDQAEISISEYRELIDESAGELAKVREEADSYAREKIEEFKRMMHGQLERSRQDAESMKQVRSSP